MQGTIGQLLMTGNGDEMSLIRSVQLMVHAIGSGMLLMLVTAIGTTWSAKRLSSSKDDDEEDGSLAEVILSSGNVMFLSFGMAGVMLLVNNNLARAFAIGAAIALVRFRIKVSSKTLSMALFYGVLAGMACGVDRVHLAWGIAATFGLLELLLLGTAGLAARLTRKPKPAQAKAASKLASAPIQPANWN
jgi:hypothetical protein